jgi:hypothetical protein
MFNVRPSGPPEKNLHRPNSLQLVVRSWFDSSFQVETPDSYRRTIAYNTEPSHPQSMRRLRQLNGETVGSPTFAMLAALPAWLSTLIMTATRPCRLC